MFPTGKSKPVEIRTVGSIPIANQILSNPKKGGKTLEPIVLGHYRKPEAIYGVGDVTLNKGYLVEEGYIRGRISRRKSDFLFIEEFSPLIRLGS